MNTIKELYEFLKPTNDLFPTRFEFMIKDLYDDYTRGTEGKQKVKHKISDWDFESSLLIILKLMSKLKSDDSVSLNEEDSHFFTDLICEKAKSHRENNEAESDHIHEKK